MFLYPSAFEHIVVDGELVLPTPDWIAAYIGGELVMWLEVPRYDGNEESAALCGAAIMYFPDTGKVGVVVIDYETMAEDSDFVKWGHIAVHDSFWSGVADCVKEDMILWDVDDFLSEFEYGIVESSLPGHFVSRAGGTLSDAIDLVVGELGSIDD